MAVERLQPVDDATTRCQFAVFAFLLAAATLFHEAALGALTVTQAIVTLAALLVLMRPSSLGLFLVLVLAQLLVFVDELPQVANHWLVLSITNLAVVAYIVWAAIGRREWPIRKGVLYERLAPVLRVELILVYIFAAVAKMNSGFFDDLNSCALILTQDALGGSNPPGLEDLSTVLSVATIATELAIPLLLIFRPTRILAIFVGLGFHTVLALAGHAAFSGFAVAFYWLFLPDDMPQRLVRVRERLRSQYALVDRALGWVRSPVFAVVVLGACAVVGAFLGAVVPAGDLRDVLDVIVIALYLVYALALTGLLVLALRDGAPLRWKSGLFRVAHPVLVIAPLLVFANGFSPYLGLKTENSFTMYSNLRTEEAHWNHWFMPQSMQVFEMQDRPVRVIASSQDELQETADERRLMTRFAFESHASRHPDHSVTYEVEGRLREVTRIGSDPALAAGPNPAADKVLWFRDIPIAAGSFCTR